MVLEQQANQLLHKAVYLAIATYDCKLSGHDI